MAAIRILTNSLGLSITTLRRDAPAAEQTNQQGAENGANISSHLKLLTKKTLNKPSRFSTTAPLY